MKKNNILIIIFIVLVAIALFIATKRKPVLEDFVSPVGLDSENQQIIENTESLPPKENNKGTTIKQETIVTETTSVDNSDEINQLSTELETYDYSFEDINLDDLGF